MPFIETDQRIHSDNEKRQAVEAAKCAELTEENAKLKEMNVKLQEAMAQMTEDKGDLEEKLMSMFLPILNSKKAEIRRLTALVADKESLSTSGVHDISDSDDACSNKEDSQSLLAPGERSIDSANFLELSSQEL